MPKNTAAAILTSLIALPLLAVAESDGAELAPAHRLQVRLDDGSKIDVDNASHMSASTLANLVLAADRSTRTGCPFDQAVKGLLKFGDRVLVTDNYIAWFAYTLQYAVPRPADWPAGPSHVYARSGTLAGFWSLDPSKQTFRYPYGSTSGTGKGDPAHNICSNWARNELIPGSDSPAGQTYWWDPYAPPLENTIVVPESQEGEKKVEFFSSVYAQKSPGSEFKVVTDGAQDFAGVHYKTQSWMTTWHFGQTYSSLTEPGQEGKILTSVEFIGKENGVEIVWDFMPTLSTPVRNLYSSIWISYSGQNPTTCSRGHNYPLPTQVYGYPSPQEPYRHARGSRPDHSADENNSAVFPWSAAVPCTRRNIGIGIKPAGAPLPRLAAVDLGDGEGVAISDSLPHWRMVQLAEPNSGTGAIDDPINFPFDRMIFTYDNSDQTYNLNLLRGPYAKPSQWFPLQGHKWYRVHYLLTTSGSSP